MRPETINTVSQAAGWTTLFRVGTPAAPVVEVERAELPPWNYGSYKQDVPKRRGH